MKTISQMLMFIGVIGFMLITNQRLDKLDIQLTHIEQQQRVTEDVNKDLISAINQNADLCKLEIKELQDHTDKLAQAYQNIQYQMDILSERGKP